MVIFIKENVNINDSSIINQYFLLGIDLFDWINDSFQGIRNYSTNLELTYKKYSIGIALIPDENELCISYGKLFFVKNKIEIKKNSFNQIMYQIDDNCD